VGFIIHNSINEPVLITTAVAQKDIEAYEISVEAFDKFGDEVKDWGFGTNRHTVISQNSMKAGTSSGQREYTMHGAETVGVCKCRLLRVKLADGTVWKPEPGAPLAFEAKVH
jgi:hypothetical protein